MTSGGPSRRPRSGLLSMTIFPNSLNFLCHPERLSVKSSGLPWFAVSQDSIEDDDKLSDAGGESLLAGFASGSELGVVGGDDRVLPAGDQGSHEEGGAHGRADTGNSAAPAPR